MTTLNQATAKPDGLGRWATSDEIAQQPKVWRDFAPRLAAIADDIRAWLAARAHDEIWFCGAGTSAFIGETLAAHLNAAVGPARFRAIATTDLVSSPLNFIRPGVRPLVVSFGRSGNSSESLGSLALLAAHAPQFDRLHITCNAESALAHPPMPGPGELKMIVLPSSTNDSGFAMTSSYTTMLLSALACFDSAPAAELDTCLRRLADAAETIITDALKVLADTPVPERAVFLGSGPLTGVARESALKVLELTAGQVTTSWDSTLGFRHGPKAVVNDRTLIFVLHSTDPFTERYDNDLANEIVAQFGEKTLVRVGGKLTAPDVPIPPIGSDAWSAVLYVVVAQILAVIWSQRLGFNVDDPFAGRNLTRVVAGVKLYDLPSAEAGFHGGIDVGGTKIEAVVFNEAFEPIFKNRIDTAQQSYDDFVQSIADQVNWIQGQTGKKLVRLGVGLPGVIDPASGIALTSNLPASGRQLRADLAAHLGLPVHIENDCKCFVVSEANGGAGADFRTVFGLIMGTGVGGGVCLDGKLAPGLNRLSGEVGHLGIPADLMGKHHLLPIQCGCGRTGCYETYVSGPGLSRIAAQLAAGSYKAEEIVRAAEKGDEAMSHVLDVWFDLLSELIYTIQLTIDAECVILGGGLSRINGVTERLAAAFDQRKLAGALSPVFRVAKYGDASGTRGAALLAHHNGGRA